MKCRGGNYEKLENYGREREEEEKRQVNQKKKK
jgi:hypothetical protein